MELLKTLHTELGTLITRLETAEAKNLFYERVLRQAVLTHGGKLPIDPQLAVEAKNETIELWIGNGGVSTYEPGKGFSDLDNAQRQLSNVPL